MSGVQKCCVQLLYQASAQHSSDQYLTSSQAKCICAGSTNARTVPEALRVITRMPERETISETQKEDALQKRPDWIHQRFATRGSLQSEESGRQQAQTFRPSVPQQSSAAGSRFKAKISSPAALTRPSIAEGKSVASNPLCLSAFKDSSALCLACRSLQQITSHVL